MPRSFPTIVALLLHAFGWRRGSCAPAFVFLFAALLAAQWLAPARCHAQAAWEFSPYQVRIWIALPDSPTWGSAQLEQFRSVLQGRAEATFGPVWSCEVDAAPAELATAIRNSLENLKVEQVQAAMKPGDPTDKLYLVSLQDVRGSLRLQVRELDYRARQFGIVVERDALQRDALPWVAWDAIASVFTPVVRIERVNGQEIAARIRAGGLITTENSPAWITPGAALKPVIRRNDRAGEPVKGGINSVPWTMLEVLEKTDSVLNCRLHSGYRSPIPSKGTSRTERLALLVRPQFPSTRLRLRSRDASRAPLVGYEVWRKTDEGNGELLGATDWRGDIELLRADKGALQTLLVRSGGQLLARLPVVPGQQAEMEAAVVNDDGRLQAEGFVVALQSKIMDLEARRQITAARLRSMIKADKLDEAQELLEQFRTLETRGDLNRLLNQQNIKSVDPTTQKRIDKLLADARALLLKFLDPELANALQRELLAAKAPRPAADPKPAAPPSAAPAATQPAAAPAAQPAT